MEFSDKQIQEIKSILEKEHGREFTWEEATQAMWSLRKLAELSFEIASQEWRRKELLKESPKGFHIDEKGCNCPICGSIASGENSWFDKDGLKCMPCQKAIDNKIIPVSVIKNRDSWYSKGDLDSYFNIKNAELNKFIKQGLLKDRIIYKEGKKIHFQLFLIKDNKDVLPPKKLLESRTVKVMRNDKEYYTQEYWYEFIEPNHYKRLMKYKITDCFKETFAKPITGGRFLYEKINPLFTHKNLKK
jgi:hypothetical protein